jgi:hypothetical protein
MRSEKDIPVHMLARREEMWKWRGGNIDSRTQRRGARGAVRRSRWRGRVGRKGYQTQMKGRSAEIRGDVMSERKGSLLFSPPLPFRISFKTSPWWASSSSSCSSKRLRAQVSLSRFAKPNQPRCRLYKCAGSSSENITWNARLLALALLCFWFWCLLCLLHGWHSQAFLPIPFRQFPITYHVPHSPRVEYELSKFRMGFHFS